MVVGRSRAAHERSFIKIKSDGKGVRQMQPEQRNSLESV
jgi:hypothetical protein